MTVHLEFLGNLKEITGREEIIMTLPAEASVLTLLEELSRKFEDLQEYLFPPSSERPYIQILVNGQSVYTLNGLDSILQDGYKVTILPAVSGGKTKKESGK